MRVIVAMLRGPIAGRPNTSGVAVIFGLLAHPDSIYLPVVLLNVHVPVLVDVHLDDAMDKYIALIAIAAVIDVSAVEIAAGWITGVINVNALFRRGQNVNIHSAVNHHRSGCRRRCDFHIRWRRGWRPVRTDFTTNDRRAGDNERRCGAQTHRWLEQGFLRVVLHPFRDHSIIVPFGG
jgi:hypothetical protein